MPHFSLEKNAPYSSDVWRQAVRIVSKIPLGSIKTRIPNSEGDLMKAAKIKALEIQARMDAETGHPDPLPLELAQLFHTHYERLAPEFGYETREDTRQFDVTKPNAALMIATCRAILQDQKVAAGGL